MTCGCSVNWNKEEYWNIRYCPMHEAAPELLEACEQIQKLLEDGILVRDVSHDAKPGWILRQIPLIEALRSLKEAISKEEEKCPAVARFTGAK